jgi:hypothetical protein
MSEYWKSTPKYWCKFCKDYVKDTKFERQQHEATGRHQSNIQRSLKGLHREQQNQERQKQRAKDEVARLNGLVPSSSTAAANANAPAKPTFAKTEEKKATLQDRKKQWEQLAAMGITVPDEARGGMALKGEWAVVKEEVVGEINEDGEFKALNRGVRKRKVDEEEAERELAGETITKKKGWGQTYKSLPGRGSDDEDIEALFKKRKTEVKQEEPGVKTEVKEEARQDAVKGEEEPKSLSDIPTAEEAAAVVKTEAEKALAETSAPTVVFKKRKKAAK